MTGRAKRLTLTIGVAATGLLLCGIACAHGPCVTPVSATIYGGELVDPGEIWVDEDMVLHVRDQQLNEFLDGDLEGYIAVTASFDLDLIAGQGFMWGALVWHPADESINGTFAGRFAGTILGTMTPTSTDAEFDGRWICRGTGDLRGQLLLIHNYGPMGEGAVQVCEGVILGRADRDD